MITFFSVFLILNNAPPPPVNLMVKRLRLRSETSNFAFEIQWENPSHSDNIIRAFYKIGSAPTKNYDTTGTLSGSPDTIYISQEGKQILFVWLMDNKDRIDYRNNTSIKLIKPFSLHLYNEIANRRFYISLILGIGGVFSTGFTSNSNSLEPFGVQKVNIEFGVEKACTELSFQFGGAGIPPDTPKNKGFYLMKGEVAISQKLEIIPYVFGVEPSLGWCYLQKYGYLKTKDESTGKEKVEIDKTYRENGMGVGINAVKYIIPNLTNVNIAGIGVKYQHLFCMEGINEFGVEVITAIRTPKDVFSSISLELKNYQSRTLNMLCLSLNMTGYL